MNALLNNAFVHWKSTVQSILTVTFALTGTLMGMSIIKPQTAALLVAVNAVAKVLLERFRPTASPSRRLPLFSRPPPSRRRRSMPSIEVPLHVKPPRTRARPASSS